MTTDDFDYSVQGINWDNAVALPDWHEDDTTPTGDTGPPAHRSRIRSRLTRSTWTRSKENEMLNKWNYRIIRQLANGTYKLDTPDN